MLLHTLQSYTTTTLLIWLHDTELCVCVLGCVCAQHQRRSLCGQCHLSFAIANTKGGVTQTKSDKTWIKKLGILQFLCNGILYFYATVSLYLWRTWSVYRHHSLEAEEHIHSNEMVFIEGNCLVSKTDCQNTVQMQPLFIVQVLLKLSWSLQILSSSMHHKDGEAVAENSTQQTQDKLTLDLNCQLALDTL